MRRKDALGRFGEAAAAKHLEQSGYQILVRNWRCRDGELDIVARDGPVLVICEVKTRSGLDFGAPLEAVTPVKARRLRRLAALWLAERHGAEAAGVRGTAHRRTEHPAGFAAVRIDVIGVLALPGRQPRIDHVLGVG